MAYSPLDRLLGRVVRRGRLELVDARGKLHQIGQSEAGFPEVRIRLTDARVARDIALEPRLGAGEAFMDGRLIIEHGDIMELVQLLRSNRPWEKGAALHRPGALRRAWRRSGAAVDQITRKVGAKANVAHHYDIGNDLYRLMLDERHMQYSCAYWPRPGMTIEEAQEAKLAHIAAKLALAPDQEVLDIGCGWGGLAIYLASRANVRVLGVTLSEEQLGLARERAAAAGVGDRVTFELIDYRDLPARGRTFDRVVSVGMFEHVGRPQFDDFFGACARLLAEDGIMLLHTIGRMGSPGSTEAFTRKYIFPGGYIPALSETVAASEKVRLIATDVETLRLHYALTLREWYKRVGANRETIEELYGPRFYRMWTFYLAGATAAFKSGSMCNYQIQYARDRRTLPLTRDYMIDAEQDLIALGSSAAIRPNT